MGLGKQSEDRIFNMGIEKVVGLDFSISGLGVKI